MTERVTRGSEPVEVPADHHVLTHLWAVEAGDDRPLLSWPRGDGWAPITAVELVDRVRSVAAGLVTLGLEPGDRVAVMSPTRFEWAVADLAIMAAGCVTVPVYDTSSTSQISAVLGDSRPRAAFVGDDATAELLRSAWPAGDPPCDIAVFDRGDLGRLARTAREDGAAEVDRRVGALRGSDLATIVYTSGTTGAPKGCRLTHHNLVWTVRQTLHRLDGVLTDTDTTLLFLPLAHVFTRIVLLVALEGGMTVGFARSIELLPEDLRTFRPTFLLAVPRVFERVFRGAQRQATGTRRAVFDFAVRAGEEWSRSTAPSLPLRLRRSIADRVVYSRLRDGLGGRVRYCVSGGAALNPALGHFFHAAGITILEGYGLTETSAPATINTPSELCIGSVGKPIPGVEIRVADDGELLVRGDNVFEGYHNDHEATAEVLGEGRWFRTGDVGEVDADGYVFVTDRKKELIVTAMGKNVAPTPLEQHIREHPLVANAMVIGDARPFLAAIVALDPDQLAASGLSPDDNLVHDQVQEAIDTANRTVSRAESIRAFRLVPRDFSEGEGELTPTMKLRRRVLLDHFADLIEEIYAGGS